MKLGRRTRRGTAGVIASVIMFAIIFSVGTGYFIFVNATNAKYVRSLVSAANRNQAVGAEALQITTLVLSNGDVGFYANNTSSEVANLTAVYVQGVTGGLLKCAGVGLPASAGCANTTPPLWILVNSGKGSPKIDTGYLYVVGTTDTLIVLTARGNHFSQTYPDLNSAVSANTAQSINVNPATFKWTTIQPSTASLVQSKYTSSCNAAACGLQYTSGVTVGNTLVYGLGWYNQNPPSTPTDTVGTTFTLGASNSVASPVTAALVQNRYTSNCNAANCGLAYSSSVTQGNVLVYGLGWYGQNPPTAPTDTRGDSFVLGPSQSVTYNPPSPSLVQSRYASNCNSASCGLAYSSSVTAGNTLVFGLGWYGTSPYVPITINNCQTPLSLALDGSGTNKFSTTNSGTVTLTTSNSNDVIVVVANNEDAPNSAIRTVSSVTATGLTFTKRASTTLGSTTYQDTEIWYAIASSALSSATITVTLSGTTDDAALVAFGVSGANTSTPWDPNGSLPATASGGPSSAPTVSGVSTSNANDMILGLEGNGDASANGGTSETAGSGFTLIADIKNTGAVNDDDAAAEYNVLSSTQSSATVAFGTATSSTTYWMMIADAIQRGTGCGPASISIDNTNDNQCNTASTCSVSITTTNSNDLIYLSITDSAGGMTVNSISDTAGLTWISRGSVTYSGNSVDVFTYYAISPGPLSSDSITVALNGCNCNLRYMVLGISGANLAAPFDPSLSSPATNTGTTTTPTVTFTTTNANDLIIGTAKSNRNAFSAAAYTNYLFCCTSQYAAIEWKIVSSAGSQTPSFTVGTTNSAWAEIGDAIQAAPATATPTTFQEMVTWNPSTYAAYESSTLGNIRFCADSACATQLYAWLESCTSSCGTSATSATAWVKLTASIAYGSSTTIYMVFEGTSVNFDGNYWGEAPNLSGTYGQYDNGANVFTFYDNFAGTSLSGKWTVVKSSGGSVAVNNGATFTASGAGDYSFVVSATQTYPRVSESYMVSANSGADPMMGVATTQSVNGHIALVSGYSIEWVSSTGTEEWWNLASSYGQMSSQSQGTFPAGIWQVTWSATGNEYFADGAGHSYRGTDSTVTPVANYGVFVGVSNYCSCNNLVDRWTRMRAYPPNGVMPSTSFGSVTSGTGSPSGPTDTLGDPFTLGASNSIPVSSVNYYSYIWFATAASSGADTITATFGSAVTGSVSVYELAGYATSGYQSSTGSSTTGSTSLSVTSFTPASNSFVIGNAETASGSSTYTAGSGFALTATCSSVYGCSEYGSGVGSATAVPMTLGASAPWVESAISFAPATSATYYSYIWYATAASSGADTVTASFSQSAAGSVSIYEFSGLTTSGVISSTGSSSTGSASSSVTSITPSTGSVVVGNTEAGSTAFTAGSGYTLSGTCGSVYGCGEYQTGVGSGTTVPMSLSPSAVWVEAALAFAPKTIAYYSYIWWGAAGASGTDTITATFSQSVVGSVSIYELNGYSTSGITTSTGALAGGSTTPAVTSFTPGTNSIVIGSAETSSSSFTAGTGFTAIGTCSSVNGCSEQQSGVSAATTAPMTLSPSASWTEVAIAFRAGPVQQSGIQLNGYPSSGIPYNTYLSWRVQFTNQDSQGRSVTLWPKSLAAIKSIIQETVEITPFFIVDGVSTDGSTLIAYNSTKPFVVIPYKQTATVYFGAMTPRGTATDRVDTANEIAPFTGFFALEGIYSDGTLYGATVPYPVGQVTNGNANTSPNAGLTSTTVTATCNSPCNFNANSNAYVGWLDSTGHLTILKTFTMTSGGNIPSNTTFQVPAATPGYYTIVISDYVNSVYVTFQHT